MNRIVFVFFLLLSGCASCATPTRLLVPSEVAARSKITDTTPLAKQIGDLYADIEMGRKVLILGVEAKIDKDKLMAFSVKLSTADYYMSKAWASMIEGDEATARQAVGMGEVEMDNLKEFARAAFTEGQEL